MANLFQWIRALCLVLLSVNYVFYFLFFKPLWFFFTFSNWTLFFTTYSVYASYEAGWNIEKFGKFSLRKAKQQGRKTYMDKLWHHAGHHILYSFSIITNLMMCFIYWPFCHRDAVEKMGKKKITGPYKVIHMYLSHLIQPIVCILNSLVTNCVLKRDLWKTFLLCAIIYVSILYFFQNKYGIIIYNFIDFE